MLLRRISRKAVNQCLALATVAVSCVSCHCLCFTLTKVSHPRFEMTGAGGGAGGQAVALVVDAEVTSYLMMGALSPGLKRHSVTLFEGASSLCCVCCQSVYPSTPVLCSPQVYLMLCHLCAVLAATLFEGAGPSAVLAVTLSESAASLCCACCYSFESARSLHCA